ncbi:MAG TPA: hypothetical protein VND93_31015 [Myxococcales bacterium]|jgi:hypothetical protein|nr:hypothetical protein [Myxococcales bacterium]
MSPDAMRRWIEAGKILAQDPAARVRCPEKGDGMLTVHDEVFANNPKMLERHLVCDACGARNVIRMRAPSG